MFKTNPCTWFSENAYALIKKAVLLLLFALMGYTAVVVLCLLCDSLSSGLEFRINTDVIQSNLIFWYSYSPLFKALFGVMTLYVAIVNLDRYISGMTRSNDIEAIRSLQSLRERLQSEEGMRKIHKTLEENPESFKITKFRIICWRGNYSNLLNYLGTLELGSIMVQKKAVSVEDFSKQFGYRVGNILESKNLVEYIVTDARYYHDLIWIIQKLVDEELIEPGNYYSKLRNLPSELVRRKTTKSK